MIKAVNPIASVTDYSALQDDLATMLMCHPLLQQLIATQERKFLLDSTMNIDALWQTPRNGGQGIGLVVEDIRPVVAAKSDGQLYDLKCGFVILGERNMAMTPGVGCLMQPEQVEAIVAGLMNGKLIQPYGVLRAEGNIGGPADDWIDDKLGLYARRVTLKIMGAWKRPDTCDLVQVSQAAGTVTITCTATSPDLQIWYTVDGSCPANDAAINPQTQIYSAPFTAPSGTIVRAAAFASTLNQSAVKQIIVT